MLYLVLTTIDRQKEALRLAQAVVMERLGACVNVIPRVKSIYWWQEKIERADEFLLLIKTTETKLKKLVARLKELHPYEVPELITLKIDSTSQEYMNWVRDSLEESPKK